jgi:hypothetical protein
VGNANYKGLPDTHDFSKHKDFFTLYIHRYCSGSKNKEGQYIVDFCSDIGRELFDQYRVWKLWGVDLGSAQKDKENALQETVGVEDIKTMPKVIFVWFLTSTAVTASTLVMTAFALCTSWAKTAALFFSVVNILCTLVTAILAQILFSKLVRRTHEYHVAAKNGAGGGVLTSILGKRALSGLWLLASFAMLSTSLLSFVLYSDRKARAAKSLSRDKDARLKDYALTSVVSESSSSKGPPRYAPRGGNPYGMPGLVKRATNKLFGATGISRYDDTSYETMRVASGTPRGRSRSAGPSTSHGNSPGEKSGGIGNSGRNSRYEPYRHNDSA